MATQKTQQKLPAEAPYNPKRNIVARLFTEENLLALFKARRGWKATRLPRSITLAEDIYIRAEHRNGYALSITAGPADHSAEYRDGLYRTVEVGLLEDGELADDGRFFSEGVACYVSWGRFLKIVRYAEAQARQAKLGEFVEAA